MGNSPPAPTNAQSAARATTAAQAFTWRQVQDRFQQSNPTLRAGAIGIDESRAQEITAHLRPNPSLYMGLDQATLLHTNPYQPLAYSYPNVVF